jgi:inosose dehydratase
MRGNRIACHAIAWAWSNTKLTDVFSEIASLGFDGIELPSERLLSAEVSWSSLKQALNVSSIPIISVYQTARLGNKDRCVREYEFKRCLALIDILQELQVRYLIIGDPPTAFNDAQTILAEILDKLGAISNSKGVNLCYHPHFGSVVETPEQIDTLMSMTSIRNLGLCLDTGHICWGGSDPSQVIRKFANRIAYIHFKDVRKRHLTPFEKLAEVARATCMQVDRGRKLKYMGSVFLQPTGFHIVEIGLGEIDFGSVLSELSAVNYEGWITIELDTRLMSPGQSLGRCLSKVDELYCRVKSELN